MLMRRRGVVWCGKEEPVSYVREIEGFEGAIKVWYKIV